MGRGILLYVMKVEAAFGVSLAFGTMCRVCLYYVSGILLRLRWTRFRPGVGGLWGRDGGYHFSSFEFGFTSRGDYLTDGTGLYEV